MTEPKAWHCPNCNAYHAPHVDTCPKPATITAPFNQAINDRLAYQGDFGQLQNAAAVNPDYIQRIIRAPNSAGTVPL